VSSITRLDSAPTPLDALAAVAHRPHVVFLDGAAEPGGMGRWSYLAAEPVEVLEGNAEEWADAVARVRAARSEKQEARQHPERSEGEGPLTSDRGEEVPRSARDTAERQPPFRGGWIGWLSYELGRAFDRQPRPARDDFQIPDFSLARYESVMAWDHLRDECWLIGDNVAFVEMARSKKQEARGNLGLTSRFSPLASRPIADFTPAEYIAAVQRVIDYVLAGDIFQANLSQRFTAPFTGDPLALYAALRRRAAGSHAAYLDRGRVQLLSMSPERFLQYDPVTRRVEARPIKGTRPRDHADPAHDTALAADLIISAKDRAENVMIVDLMRNDLHRVCAPASVEVPSLCRLESHAAVHHLVSIVTGTLASGHDALDLIAATFPGGSITGAPKLRAMDIIAELEPVARGVYCGAIGWIGHDGALDLNIAIRTVTLADGIASVHAGGGITALSDPAAEYQETLDKAQALLDALAEVS
jgi:para-aminobenzoate synthetase component 1